MAAPTRYESLRDEELGASAPAPAPGGPAASFGWQAAPVASAGWGDEDHGLAGTGAGAVRDWRGGIFQCVGSGSSRDWQLCCLSCFCSPIAFGANMKRALGLDFARQSLIAFFCLSFTHWVVNLSSYSKCGNPPPFPYGDMTATSSDFAWQAYDYAASRYAACNRPYSVAQVFMWIISWAFFGYAGWRRVQMRRRFGLPGDDVRDYTTWMLCPMCALCQEGRTLLHNRVDNGVWHGPAPLPQQGMGAPPVQAFGGAGGVFEAQRPYATLPPGQYPPAPQGANPWAAPSLLPQQAATGVPPPPPPPPRVQPALAQPAAGMYVPPSATDVDAAAK